MPDSLFASIFRDHDALMLLVEPDDGRILAANRAAERFYGYTDPPLVGRTIQDINLLPPAEVAGKRARALARECNRFVFPHRLADGERRLMEIHSSPIVWHGATILFSILHDITERHEVERVLRESEQRFRRLFDSAPDAMFVADPATGLIGDANAAAVRLIGRTREEIVGMHFT